MRSGGVRPGRWRLSGSGGERLGTAGVIGHGWLRRDFVEVRWRQEWHGLRRMVRRVQFWIGAAGAARNNGLGLGRFR